MSMERSIINVYFLILLTVLVCWVVKCGKLDGYSFPVYTTASCPRNQSEWTNRSSALNCTESNGYMCIPNENITQLLEFCYRYPRIPIEKDICLFLRKKNVESYSCKQFKNGCPDKVYWSNEIFKYPSCTNIGNKCFLAEPLCNEQGIATIGRTGTQNRTTMATNFESHIIEDIDGINISYWILGLGVFLPILSIIMLTIIFKGGKQITFGIGLHKAEEDCPINAEKSQLIETKDEKMGSEEIQNQEDGIYLDGYDVWKTGISENYKLLSSEERAVLFVLIRSNRNSIDLENREKILEEISKMSGKINIPKNIQDSILAMQTKGFVSIVDGDVTFSSDDVQDETMFDYLHTLLDKKIDSSSVDVKNKSSSNSTERTFCSRLERILPSNFSEVLSRVSTESSLKYFRSQKYQEGKFVRCFLLNNSTYTDPAFSSLKDKLNEIINKCGKDILIHKILDDKSLHTTISTQLKIPEEVLLWDLDARLRYLEYLTKGKTPIYRARAMVVGCAGVGKTTFLERLQKKSMEEIKSIKSTVGLDVHNDIFEVQEKRGKLEGAKRKHEPELHINEDVPLHGDKIEEKKLLSILDFGGQCMYYACHQIYLSKRAFYILVVDMSKNLESVIDEKLCDQKDTMFSHWSHKDYLLFWLKSVDSYCGREAPVILVATHAEGKSEREQKDYYEEIIKSFPPSSTIKEHLSIERYFMISLPKNKESALENLDEVERCIVHVATSQQHWGEEVPIDWATFEEFILEEKDRKLQTVSALKESFDKKLPLSEQEFRDLLRFYHDIGLILFFSFKNYKGSDFSPLYLDSDIVILDIQWFVNSFKYVVTDSKQESFDLVFDAAPTRDDFDNFKATGHISDTFLKKIWEKTNNQKAVDYKDDMIKYMERLGIMAIEKLSDVYFIPSMNRMRIPVDVKSKIASHPNKSPTLYFKFPVLPIFLFYRLIVLCLKQWEPLVNERKCIYIDTAMFAVKKHVLVLGVSESYIQLILYRNHTKAEKEMQLAFMGVKKEVTIMLSSLTKTVATDLEYEVGYSCKPTEFGKELGQTFIRESTMLNHYDSSCPLHQHSSDHDTLFLKVFLQSERRVNRENTSGKAMFHPPKKQSFTLRE